MGVAEVVRAARTASGLSAEEFARLVDLTCDRLGEIEAGAQASPDEVDRCARLFGLRITDLLRGDVGASPMTFLFKAASARSLDVLDQLNAHTALGDFMRVVRDANELAIGAGREMPRLPRLADPSGGHQFEGRAAALRAHLGLDASQPVESVRDEIAKLGVGVVFTDDERLSAIGGASTGTPWPAILINVPRPGHFWRTRMTALHELAHLLFDQHREQPLVFSPTDPSRWRLYDGFNEFEQHADAFAACFLAPATAVRSVVGDAGPDSMEAIRRVGATYGVGRLVAINRLVDVFRLSPQIRTEMLSQPCRWESSGAFSRDIVQPDEIGLRRGWMPELVRQALEVGHVRRSRACRLLGLPPHAAADACPGVDLGSPDAAIRRRIMTLAAKYLVEAKPGQALQPLEAEPSGARWKVTIAAVGIGERQPRAAGYLLVGPGLAVEPHLQGAR